ncbi:MAG TPA: hypothetical protein VGD87_04190 [Archangium sp.]
MYRNLADPAYEPTDDDLRELSRTAFAHLAQARRDADARLRDQIAVRRAEALSRLREPPARGELPGLRVVAGPPGAGKASIPASSECVFSELDELSVLERARTLGRFIHVSFISTGDPRICAARVTKRVMHGGPSVPIERILSGYVNSMANLSGAILLADWVDVFDNSVDGRKPRHCARIDLSKLRIIDGPVPDWLVDAMTEAERHLALLDAQHA